MDSLFRTDNMAIVGVEEIKIPAGTFKTYKVENQSHRRISLKDGLTFDEKIEYWFEPGWGVPLKIISHFKRNALFGDNSRDEIREVISRKRGAG